MKKLASTQHAVQATDLHGPAFPYNLGAITRHLEQRLDSFIDGQGVETPGKRWLVLRLETTVEIEDIDEGPENDCE